jgi:Putative GTPase activating protein for Arf
MVYKCSHCHFLLCCFCFFIHSFFPSFSGLGTHVSFVRSVKMDAWTEAQVAKMKCGGNQRCREFLKSHGINMSYSMVNGGTCTTSFKDRYDTPAAQLYQQVIKARVAGLPEPTELPPPRPQPSSSATAKQPMTGFGSAPPPSSHSNSKAASRRRTAMAGALTGAALVAWSIVRRKSQQPQRE